MRAVVKYAQVFLAAAGLVATVAEPAAASAVGYAKVVGFCHGTKTAEICVPVTTLGHFVQGSGKKISRQEASIQDVFGADSAGGRWCNWHFDWRYSDTNGRTYLVSKGPIRNGCDMLQNIGRVDKQKRTLKHYGKACVDFYAGGAKRATQCHNIIK
ncbi:hypothetical protein [Streptomyces sp. NPDC047928]|uniref:hypothetical protein n=1 Tax=unclassified Streptomyces TaxID=2593676 RepID=UPI00371BBEE7